MCARVTHKTQVESKVVDGCNLHGQQLLGFEQVVQVGFRVNAVDGTPFWIDGGEVGLPFLVPHVHGAFIRKKHGIPAIAGRHDAVEHVDTTFNSFKNVLRRADAHQVARLVFWQDFVYHLNHVVHDLSRFAYGQSTNGIAVSSLVGHILGGFLSQVFKGAALNNGEQRLLVTV